MSFFKISPKEIDEYNRKIQEKYSQYTKEFGEKFFDIKNYKNRYITALKNKINLESFFKAELNIIEDIKNKALLRRQQEQNQVLLNKKMESMAEMISLQIEKYPEADLGERANIEIKKLIGTCQFLYPKLEQYKSLIPLPQLIRYNSALQLIVGICKEPYLPSLKNYLEIIANPLIPISRADIFSQKIIKDIGISLKTIISLLEEIVEKDPSIANTITNLQDIVKDFRLEIFQTN
jgi:hypothetical protein